MRTLLLVAEKVQVLAVFLKTDHGVLEASSMLIPLASGNVLCAGDAGC